MKRRRRHSQSITQTGHTVGVHVPGAIAILLMVGAAYLPAMRGGFVWDDDQYVHANPTLTNLDGLRRIWLEPRATPQYYPLVFTTFWVEYRLWGLNPLGYHVVNVVLHTAGAVLAWAVLRRLMVPGAWLAAAVFALHPVHVESVAWITERKNVLSTVFYLASMRCYLAYDSLRGETSPPSSGVGAYSVCLALFVGALLSKSVTCSLPAAILLVLWWKYGRVRASDVLRLSPFFLLGLAAASVTAWLERVQVGAMGPEFSLPFSHRLLIAGRAVWFYLGKLVWPHPLIFVYPKWEIDPSHVAQYLYGVAAAGLVLAWWRWREHFGRGPLAAVLYYGGTLFPALGFFNIYFALRYSPVADHFQYLASIGPIALLVGLAAHVTAKLKQSQRRAAAAAVLAVLAVLTFVQCGAYADTETLWTRTLERNPSAWIAHNNLCTLYEERGDLNRAVQHLSRAVALNPDCVEIRKNLGALGASLLKHGRLGEAERHLREAVRLDPLNFEAQSNLGVVLLQQGLFDEAAGRFQQAVRLDPNNVSIRFNLGCTLLNLGRLDEAIVHLREARRLDPADAETRENLQKALDLKSLGHP